MIKQITQNILAIQTEMLYCDWCGEGLSQQTDNDSDVKEFVNLHTNCTKPRNKKLNFLDKCKLLVQ